MSALDLTVYPKLERPIFGFEIMPYREQWKREKALIESKRLTDAELAAEWHKQDGQCAAKCEGYSVAHNGEPMGSEYEEIEKLRTLYRFATLPHYDEADQ